MSTQIRRTLLALCASAPLRAPLRATPAPATRGLPRRAPLRAAAMSPADGAAGAPCAPPPRMRVATYTPGCAAAGVGVADAPLPPVAAGDVLIRVAYAGVGGSDFAQRRGGFNPAPGTPPHQKVMGLEVSGVVAEVGDGVDGFAPGDRVAALLYGGGYAEYAVTPQELVLELPDNFTLAQGAAVPENFWTAWSNLFEPATGNLLDRPEEKTLLVHGGSGGIGSTALALAHAFGVGTITTVSSAEKADAARRFGADLAVNYNERDFVEAVRAETAGRGVDVVLCFLGGDYTPRNIDALAPHGRLVQLGLRRGKNVTFNLKALMSKWGILTGGHMRPRTLEQKRATRDALREHVLPRWRDGSLPPPEVMCALPLAEAGWAQAMLEEGKVIGKVVLEM